MTTFETDLPTLEKFRYIEAEASRMRAEAFRSGVQALLRAAANLLHKLSSPITFGRHAH